LGVAPKLGKIPVRDKADKGGKVVGQFKKTEEAVADGREENGTILVSGECFGVWVNRNLVRRSGG
jgi:hypothetical protein